MEFRIALALIMDYISIIYFLTNFQDYIKLSFILAQVEILKVKEFFHSTATEHLRCIIDKDDGKLENQIKLALIVYNNIISLAIGMKPMEVLIEHTKTKNSFDLFCDKIVCQEQIKNENHV